MNNDFWVRSEVICQWFRTTDIHGLAFKKLSYSLSCIYWVPENDIYKFLLSLMRRFGIDFYSWLPQSWKSLPNRLTHDKVSVFMVTHALLHVISFFTGSSCSAFLQQWRAFEWSGCGSWGFKSLSNSKHWKSCQLHLYAVTSVDCTTSAKVCEFIEQRCYKTMNYGPQGA